jgi:thymine-DNA glycosylase
MRKNYDRYNGVTEAELYQMSLDDVVDYNLDVIVVNINPGLYSVHKGHHYSGPGNHFYRCVFQSGLTDRVLKSVEDKSLLDFRIGLMNMSEKANIKSCQDLTADEIREAQTNLTKKIMHYRPRIVAFNGKTIFEIYTGQSVNNKEFNFGKQPTFFANESTNIVQFVMPSSSARCSQLPKVVDKVPFYVALKKLKDHLSGRLSYLNDMDIMFPDFKVALDSSSTAGMTDANDDDEEDDDDGGGESTTPQGGRTIRFVRLNNLPYSDLPREILDTLSQQRQHKKSVTLTTQTKHLFVSLRKGSESHVDSSHHSNNYNHQQQNHGTTTPQNSSKSKVSKSICSDLDTASTATNDSSSDFDSVNSFNGGGYNNNNNNLNTAVTSFNNVNSNNGSASRLTSIIQNICSSSKSSDNNNQTLSTSNNVNSQAKFVNSLANDTSIKSSSASIKIASDLIKINNQRQQAVLLPKPQINNYNNSNNINSNQELNKRLNQPILVNTQTPPLQSTSVNHSLPLSLTVALPSPSSNVATIEAAKNENDILFELIKIDRYVNDDFYTFEPLDNRWTNPSVVLTDEYSSALNHDLNRVIRLEYDDGNRKMNENDFSKKRCFSNINDATSFLFNMGTYKRQCRIDLSNF